LRRRTEGRPDEMLAEAISTATRGDVLAALKQASAATGSDFNYLLCTAMRESSLRPQAKSGSSSACGLFQFVEQTWFGLVKQYGARHGLGSYANAIRQGNDGRFDADNSTDRQAILALRNDPRVSALMAGEFANETRSSLESSLGRNVSNGELYAAHFLGPEAACRLIRMNEAQPQACAATAFPQAANANRAVFYHSDGAAKSVREVYAWALNQPASGQTQAAVETAAQSGTHLGNGKSTASALSPEDWVAMQLWAATQSTMSLLSPTALPQSPLAATPSMLDVLGSLADPEVPGKPDV
jgi:hypothetical protein